MVMNWWLSPCTGKFSYATVTHRHNTCLGVDAKRSTPFTRRFSPYFDNGKLQIHPSQLDRVASVHGSSRKLKALALHMRMLYHTNGS
jgi:hypothetical protein